MLSIVQYVKKQLGFMEHSDLSGQEIATISNVPSFRNCILGVVNSFALWSRCSINLCEEPPAQSIFTNQNENLFQSSYRILLNFFSGFSAILGILRT